MIEYSIPDSNGTRMLNFLLLELMKEQPQLFYKGIAITSTYGAMNGCTWNGGRDILGIASEIECKQILEQYGKYGVSYRYTFTNKLIEKKDLYDRYCNMLLRINTKNNGVTYNSKLIKSYIKNKKLNYYFISSCTKNINEIKKINKISKKELIVLDFKLNNTSIIKKLRYPENIEIIVNEQCMGMCPFREMHYSMIAKKNMFISDKDFNFNPMCKNKKGSYHELIGKQPHYVSKKLIEEYYKLGINKFKIVGRDNYRPDLAIMGYMDYLIKPEYHNRFIELCKINNII